MIGQLEQLKKPIKLLQREQWVYLHHYAPTVSVHQLMLLCLKSMVYVWPATPCAMTGPEVHTVYLFLELVHIVVLAAAD